MYTYTVNQVKCYNYDNIWFQPSPQEWSYAVKWFWCTEYGNFHIHHMTHTLAQKAFKPWTIIGKEAAIKLIKKKLELHNPPLFIIRILSIQSDNIWKSRRAIAEASGSHGLNWLGWRRTLVLMLYGPKNTEAWGSLRRLFCCTICAQWATFF